jgi:hypothetical protein
VTKASSDCTRSPSSLSLNASKPKIFYSLVGKSLALSPFEVLVINLELIYNIITIIIEHVWLVTRILKK